MKNYQPKTGKKCYCRKGIERDNCPACEGTGLKIDFNAIRKANVTPQVEALPERAPLGLKEAHDKTID